MFLGYMAHKNLGAPAADGPAVDPRSGAGASVGNALVDAKIMNEFLRWLAGRYQVAQVQPGKKSPLAVRLLQVSSGSAVGAAARWKPPHDLCGLRGSKGRDNQDTCCEQASVQIPVHALGLGGGDNRSTHAVETHVFEN